MDMDYAHDANCKDMDSNVFFDPVNEDRAKDVCDGCQVKTSCLEYAISREIVYGVWGGMAPHERSTYERLRRRAMSGRRTA
jgi:WhiB family transcriptional regulator, redox-sensing transcriptional regulator